MRALTLVLAIFCSAGLDAQTSAPAAAVDLRVVAAFIEHDCTDLSGQSICGNNLHLRVDDGQHVLELAAVRDTKEKDGFNLPALGNYKARLTRDVHRKPFQSARQYELNYPDGSTGLFDVVGEFSREPGDPAIRK